MTDREIRIRGAAMTTDPREALERLTSWRDAGDGPVGYTAGNEAFAADVSALLSLLEWRPISEAPKDGTVIMIHNPNWLDGTVHPAKWMDDPSGLGCDWQTIDGWYSDGVDASPTHFLPLTAAPTEDKP